MKAMRFLLPLGFFVVLVGFLYVGLFRDPHEVPSPLVDKNGVIRYKQIGPITQESLQKTILPLVQQLQKS